MTALVEIAYYSGLKGVYKIRKISDRSYWLYYQDLGFNGQMASTPRIVFFGRSKEQLDTWVERINNV